MKDKIILPLFSLIVFLTVMLCGNKNLLPFLTTFVFAHCDTLDGPVVKDAWKALETGNVNLILKWVKKKDEIEIKKAFEKALVVRKINSDAKELADMYFYETLVRIHRAGEGAPYTGLKPAGAEMNPAVAAADKAIESGSIDKLAKEMSSDAVNAINERFKNVLEKKKHVNESIEAGREYVEAYVEFVHYAERLHNDVSTKAGHHGEPEGGEVKEQHKH